MFNRKKDDGKDSNTSKQVSKRAKKKTKYLKTKNVPESEIMLKFILNIINSLKKTLPYFLDESNRSNIKIDVGLFFYPQFKHLFH